MRSVDWNPDSARLASGEADGTVRIWHVQETKTLRTLSGPKGTLESLGCHPGGERVIATVLSMGPEPWAVKLSDAASSYQKSRSGMPRVQESAKGKRRSMGGPGLDPRPCWCRRANSG